MCSVTQHAISTHLQQLYSMLSTGDFSNEMYSGTSVGGIATVLAGLGVPDRSAGGPSMPKQRVTKKSGRPAKHRLGSAQSTLTGTIKRKCGFCGSNQHATSVSCPGKADYGDFIKITSKTDTNSITSIANKLDEIIGGKHVDFNDMTVVIGAEEIKRRMFMESIPRGTRR